MGLAASTLAAILRITPTIAKAVRKMIRCHLSALMVRDKLRISDVARLTAINRSTVSALHRETSVRIELPDVELLCQLFRCQVGDLFELDAADDRVAP